MVDIEFKLGLLWDLSFVKTYSTLRVYAEMFHVNEKTLLRW